MQRLKTKGAPLIFMFIIPLLGYIYQFLNVHSKNAHDMSTFLDKQTPFISVFILPYLFWYTYIFFYLLYFCFKDANLYKKSLLFIIIGEMIYFSIYAGYQTTVQRPELTEEGFLKGLVRWVYQNDKPLNCFPSIHVLTTYTIMLLYTKIKDKHPLHSMSVFGMGTAIILSTCL